MSNSKGHYQTALDLGVFYLLRYISVPIFGVNTMSYLAASVTNNNNLLIQVHCSNPKKCCSLYASLGLSSSPLLIKKSIWSH